MSQANNESDTSNESEASNESDASNKSDETDHDMYTIRPPIEEKFNATKVKDIVKAIVYEELDGKRYHSFKPEEMNGHLRHLIHQKLAELPYQRYKYVIELVLAEQKGQGLQFLSACLWDSDTDNVATEFINTEFIICIVAVFGVYYY